MAILGLAERLTKKNHFYTSVMSRKTSTQHRLQTTAEVHNRFHSCQPRTKVHREQINWNRTVDEWKNSDWSVFVFFVFLPHKPRSLHSNHSTLATPKYNKNIKYIKPQLACSGLLYDHSWHSSGKCAVLRLTLTHAVMADGAAVPPLSVNQLANVLW